MRDLPFAQLLERLKRVDKRLAELQTVGMKAHQYCDWLHQYCDWLLARRRVDQQFYNRLLLPGQEPWTDD